MSLISHRLLATFDSADPLFAQNHTFHPGIKIASELSAIFRAVYFFFGWTIELQLNNNYYVVGRKSLEKLLLRHRAEAGLTDGQTARGWLSWPELVQATKQFLENERIRNELHQEQYRFIPDNSQNDRVHHAFLTDFTTPAHFSFTDPDQDIKIWDNFSHFVTVNRFSPLPLGREQLPFQFEPNQGQRAAANNAPENHDFIFDRIPGLEKVPRGEKSLSILRTIQQLATDCQNPAISSIPLVKDDKKYLIQKLSYAIYAAHDPQRFGLVGNPFRQPVDIILSNLSKFSLIECMQLHDVISSENGLPLPMISEHRNKKLAEENAVKNAPVKEANLQRLKVHSQRYKDNPDHDKSYQWWDLIRYLGEELVNCTDSGNEKGKSFLTAVFSELIS
jgi:hypothetical protein